MALRQTGIILHSDTPNPWDSPPSSGSRAPKAPRGIPHSASGTDRGGGNHGGGNIPPELPPILTHFRDMMGPGANPSRVIMTLIGIVVLVWLASGLYRVLPEENAVVLRFGRYTETVTAPGLHYHLPWPIERVMKPNVTFERRIVVGYRDAYEGGPKQDIPEESLMLTGDANIVDLNFVVQWKVADAKQFLFNIRDPEGTLKRVAESAMREVTGQNNLQDIITDRREDIALRVKAIMQSILDSYAAGLMVTQVLIQDASVPAPVLDAFEDVIRANQQAETMRNQALRYRNEVTPRAQGDAIRMVKEAEGYKERVIAEAKGDAQRFIDVYRSYALAKEVTRDRLYLEAWEDILNNSNTIILDNKGTSALPYLNLNELKAKAPQTDSPAAPAQETIR